MSESIFGTSDDSIAGSIGVGVCRVAGGLHKAAEGAGCTARKAHDGVGEIREVIRAQPISAALAVFALGYLFGRLGTLILGSQRG